MESQEVQMNKTLLIVIIVAAALALGIGGGYAVSQALPAPDAQFGGDETTSPGPYAQVTPNPDNDLDEEDEDGILLPTLDPNWFNEDGMHEFMEQFGSRMGNHGWMEKGFIPPGLLDRNRNWPEDWRYWGPGGMGPWGDDFEVNGDRITLEQALSNAQEFTDKLGDSLSVTRMYEFKNVFYAVVEDMDSGMGAFELLIQPVSGNVRMETGPCVSWNTVYGRRAAQSSEIPQNTLSMQEAADQARQALSEHSAVITIDENGVEFPGYYTFEYQMDGQVSGLISVNAEDGEYWFHNWLGNFISREDVTK
jgi:hypothetical protein